MGANATLVREFYEQVWNQRREATIDELMHPDMVGKMEGRDVLGPAQFKEARRELLAAFPDLKIKVEDTIEQGDKVVVRWTATGTNGGPLAGAAPTNRPFAARGLTWMELADGRIVRGWDSWNLGGLILALREPAKAS